MYTLYFLQKLLINYNLKRYLIKIDYFYKYKIHIDIMKNSIYGGLTAALLLTSPTSASIPRNIDSSLFFETPNPLLEICGIPVKYFENAVKRGVKRKTRIENDIYEFRGGAFFTDYPDKRIFTFQSPEISEILVIDYESGNVGRVISYSSRSGFEVKYSREIKNKFCNLRI